MYENENANCVHRSETRECFPNSGWENNPIATISIPATSGTYTSLDMWLHVKYRLEKMNGEPLTSAEPCCATSNIAAALFKSATVKFNNTYVSETFFF